MLLARKQARAQLEADWAQLHASWQKAGSAAEVLAQQDPVEAAFHQQHAKLQTLLAAANTTPDRAALEKFLKTATPDARPSRIYASQNERYYGCTPILNFEAPTAALAGKKVTLTLGRRRSTAKGTGSLDSNPATEPTTQSERFAGLGGL
jgi:hypothetical protein